MSELEKKRESIYDLLNAETKLKFICLPYIKQRNIFLHTKKFFEEKVSEKTEQKTKRRFLNCSRYGD